MTISEIDNEFVLIAKALKWKIANLHLVVYQFIVISRSRLQRAESHGVLPYFVEGYFVLMALDGFTGLVKIYLHWRGPRQITKAINYYIIQAEDLRNGQLEDVHDTWIKYYEDSSLDNSSVVLHVVSSEKDMSVQLLMCLIVTDESLMEKLRWRGLAESEDTVEPIIKVFKNAS